MARSRTPDETFKRFNAEGKLTQRHAALGRKSPLAKALQVFRPRVFRSVDDPQVLRTSALDRRLNKTTLTKNHKIRRLDNHAFSAIRCHGFPPSYERVCSLGILETRRTEGRFEQKHRIRVAQLSQSLHVPNVRLVDMHRAFARENMAWCELDVVDTVDRPAIVPIRINVLIHERRPIVERVLKLGDIESAT